MLNNASKKPTTILRHQNDITVSWKESTENDEEYILQILDEFKQWKTVYSGRKMEVNIDNLEPYTCYYLRVRKLNSSDWINFRATTDDGPFCVLHMTRALQLGKTALLRKIVQKRPGLLEVENKEHKTPLMRAIENGDIQLATFLISLGANVNTRMLYVNRTPLMLAVYRGQLQIATLLINKGADVKATDINGLNILHHAVDSDRIESVQFALDNGINVNDVDKSGWTPLLRAAILKSKEDIIHMLLKNGSDITLKDIKGFDFQRHCELGGIKYKLT